MSGQIFGQVVDFNRTKLPIDIIYTNGFVKFNQLHGLPVMADITELLHTAAKRTFADMFLGGEAHVETFLRRSKEVPGKVQEQINLYNDGQLPVNVPRLEMRASMPVRAPAPEPVPF